MNQKGFANITLIVLIIVVVVGATGYLYWAKKTAVPAEPVKTVITPPSQQTQPQSNNSSSQTPSPTNATAVKKCDSAECFVPKFTSCEPASLQVDFGIGARFYEIIGPKSEGCNILIKFTKSTPSLTGKEMKCVLDNKIAFGQAIQNNETNISKGIAVQCEGSLYTTLKSGN